MRLALRREPYVENNPPLFHEALALGMRSSLAHAVVQERLGRGQTAQHDGQRPARDGQAVVPVPLR
eukprot:8099242-Pyramimonas_sp.AAC.1